MEKQKQIYECDPLTALYNYYQKNKDTDDYLKNLSFGWVEKEVGIIVSINMSGELKSVKNIGERVEQYGKKEWVSQTKKILPLSFVRTSGVKAAYITDNPKYMFGLVIKGSSVTTDEDAMKCREAFVNRWKKLRELVPDSKEIDAVLSFYRKYSPQDLIQRTDLCDALKTGQTVMFQLSNGTEFHTIKAVREAVSQGIELEYANNARCICRFSGKEDAVCDTWKAWRGGGAEGKLPTYYNATSFKRFGYEQGLNSLVGVHSEWEIWSAFKSLDRTSVTLGAKDPKTIYLFWNEDGSEPDAIANLFNTARQKKKYVPDDEDGDPICYVLGITYVGRKGIFFKECLCGNLSVFTKHINAFQEIVKSHTNGEGKYIIRDIVQAMNENRKATDRGLAPGRLDSKKITNDCGDELVDILFNGKQLSPALFRIALEQFEKYMYQGYSLASWHVGLVLSLIDYGLSMGEEEMKGEAMEKEKDARWLLGGIIACVHRMQELVVFRGSWRTGKVYDEVSSKLCRDTWEAYDYLTSQYHNVYLKSVKEKGKLIKALACIVDKRFRELSALFGEAVEEGFPSKMTASDRGRVALGFTCQMVQFYTKSSKKQTEGTEQTEETEETVVES